MSQTIFTLDSVPDSKLTTVRWGKGVSSEPLEKFQEDNKPSTSKAGQDGWVWTMGNQPRREKVDEAAQLDALTQAEVLLLQAEQELLIIKNDKNRAPKGAPTKKERKAAVEDEFIAKLTPVARAGGLTCGKWLFFTDAENADFKFNTLATSIVSGPLSQLGNGTNCCHTVKCSNALDPPAEGAPDTRVICLYFDSCWDKDMAKQVLHCVLREHGLEPSACKPDLYSFINLDSKRKSQIRASVFNKNLIPEAEREILKKKWQKETDVDSNGKIVKKSASNNERNEFDSGSEGDEANFHSSQSSSDEEIKISNPQNFQTYESKATNSRTKTLAKRNALDELVENELVEKKDPFGKGSLGKELAGMNDPFSSDSGRSEKKAKLNEESRFSAKPQASKEKSPASDGSVTESEEDVPFKPKTTTIIKQSKAASGSKAKGF